jgi:hypothetical protein
VEIENKKGKLTIFIVSFTLDNWILEGDRLHLSSEVRSARGSKLQILGADLAVEPLGKKATFLPLCRLVQRVMPNGGEGVGRLYG